MTLVLWPEKRALTDTGQTGSSLRGGESEPIWGIFNCNGHKSSSAAELYSIQLDIFNTSLEEWYETEIEHRTLTMFR